jgi:hypothetical protein
MGEVEPHMRRKGVGSALMQRLMDEKGITAGEIMQTGLTHSGRALVRSMLNRAPTHLREYIRGMLSEMAAPRQSDLERVYYHGTPKEENAKSIMTNGINTPDLSTRSGPLKPVEGKVYITPKISYASIYAIGGDMAGSEVPDWMFKDYGRYGYVFVINGQQLKDIQPDEDSVGEMISNGEEGWLADLARDALEYEDYDDEGQDLGYNDLYDAVMGGEYDAWASAGKIVLDSMRDGQKLELIDLGAHVAHTGNLAPKEVWRFDRNRTIELAKDGSNFFDLAERIQ